MGRRAFYAAFVRMGGLDLTTPPWGTVLMIEKYKLLATVPLHVQID